MKSYYNYLQTTQAYGEELPVNKKPFSIFIILMFMAGIFEFSEHGAVAGDHCF